MKHNFFFIVVLASLAAISCTCRDVETEIIPIQDNPAPRLMPRSLFADAPDSLFATLGLEDGIPSSVCAFLVRSEGKNILFDAANGAPDSRLKHVLDSCGTSPQEIDMIFITHMHGDHIGGLMEEGHAAFPNAQLYINKDEYDAWMGMPEEQNAGVRSVVQAYAGRLTAFDAADELPCGIKAVEAYGHTPGHTAYIIGDILIAGDIMHGTALQKDHPQYCARFDMNKEESVRSRRKIIEMAETEGLEMYGMHFPTPYHL